MGIENEGPRAASVGLMGMSVQLLLAGRGEVFSRSGGRFNNTFADLLLCPRYWARCHGRERNPPKLCARWGWGVACSSVKSSCSFLYLDSIFVKQEDSFDRALVFHV